MTPFTRRAILLAVLMLGASMLSVALTPTRHAAAEVATFNLETLIPSQFGDWQMEEHAFQSIVTPDRQAFIDSIYSQTLSRTYFNRDGRRIMLSVAYGKNQSDRSRIHVPEVCYPSQGFQITGKWKDTVSTDSMNIPVMRLMAHIGNRHEPVTYWMRIGNSVARGLLEQSFARISYGLNGTIPDGILFRVSEINPDTRESFVLQDQFIGTLLSSLASADRKILIGSTGSKNEDVDIK